MGVANVPAAAAGGGGLEPKFQKFTSSGTFTLPAGYGPAKPLLVNVLVIGGGGAGNPDEIASFTGNLGYGTHNNYFGRSEQKFFGCTSQSVATGNNNGKGGGSGGLASTQMYLTSNLTITVGAAGQRQIMTLISNNSDNLNSGLTFSNPTNQNQSLNLGPLSNTRTAGSGGTTTAGLVSATGGAGAVSNQIGINFTSNAEHTITQTMTVNAINAINGYTAGTGGQPAGSTGDAIPLLGTLAGGSGNTTPIYGSFGISGKRGDGATHTGVEGTGGGVGSTAGSGAVILTWWE